MRSYILESLKLHDFVIHSFEKTLTVILMLYTISNGNTLSWLVFSIKQDINSEKLTVTLLLTKIISIELATWMHIKIF